MPNPLTLLRRQAYSSRKSRFNLIELNKTKQKYRRSNVKNTTKHTNHRSNIKQYFLCDVIVNFVVHFKKSTEVSVRFAESLVLKDVGVHKN